MAVLLTRLCFMLLTKIPFKVKVRHCCISLKTSYLERLHCSHSRVKPTKKLCSFAALIKMHLCGNSQYHYSLRKKVCHFSHQHKFPPPPSITEGQCFYFHFNASYFSHYNNNCYCAPFVTESFNCAYTIAEGCFLLLSWAYVSVVSCASAQRELLEQR